MIEKMYEGVYGDGARMKHKCFIAHVVKLSLATIEAKISDKIEDRLIARVTVRNERDALTSLVSFLYRYANSNN